MYYVFWTHCFSIIWFVYHFIEDDQSTQQSFDFGKQRVDFGREEPTNTSHHVEDLEVRDCTQGIES